MPGPLEGVRVVEIGVWVAGPATAGILADWGADVIKIEPPQVGDPARSFGGILGGDLPYNPPFEMDNRGKRSVAIDLSREEGRALALDLIDGADVLVTNVRLAALRRLGLGPEAILERCPRLVYAALTGYGLHGPDADRAAYDIAGFWARGGIAGALMPPGGPPPFQRGGMGDHSTAIAMAGAISAGLFARERTGRGQLVSTSLLRMGIYTLSFDLAVALRYGVTIAGADRTAMGNPTINSYRDRDGRWFWLVGLEAERHWPPLARVVGHPEWIDDARFATPVARFQNARELVALLDAVFATKTLDEWKELFAREEDLWWAPVQSIDDLLADPQARAAGGWVEVPDGESTTTLPATPADFAGTPWHPRRMAPGHGEHTDEVLRELGVDADALARLRSDGVIA